MGRRTIRSPARQSHAEAVFGVHVQDTNGGASDRGEADEQATIPREVVSPGLAARIEERDDLPIVREMEGGSASEGSEKVRAYVQKRSEQGERGQASSRINSERHEFREVGVHRFDFETMGTRTGGDEDVR